MVTDGNETVGPESIPVGATVLVRSAGGTDPLAFVSDWHSTRPTLLAVAVDRPIQLFLAEWRACADAPPAEIGLVGVGERMRSAGEYTASCQAGNVIRTVTDPTDLDTIVDHVRTLLDGWTDHAGPTVVVVDSVTGLFDVAPEHAVAAFVADLADLVAEVGAVGFLTVRCQAEYSIDAVQSACVASIEATADGWHPIDAATRPKPLLTDEMFSLLADGRRRQILHHLYEHDRTTVPDLVDSLTAETDTAERSQLTVALAHTHLPKLADAGVVEYDEQTKSVVATSAVDRFRPLLELADSVSRT